MKKNTMKFVTGAALGVSLGVLFAPKKGSETRANLKKKAKELSEKLKNIETKDIKKDINRRMKKIDKELRNLDKEKVVAIAKKKSDKIIAEAEKIVTLAKEKGNEALEQVASEFRVKAIDMTKMILDKLESADKETK